MCPGSLPRTRIGIQIIQERDGYDHTAGKSREFDSKRG